jgi:hypothetical protein
MKVGNARYFHEEASPNHFIKVLFAPGLGMLPIPGVFKPYFGRSGEDQPRSRQALAAYRTS